MAEKTKEKNQPAAKIRFGNATATVWKNVVETKDGKSFDTYSVDVSRSYTDQKGEWQQTHSFRAADVPKAILALQEAYKWCNTKKGDTEDES